MIRALAPALNCDLCGVGEVVSGDVLTSMVGNGDSASETLAEITPERIGMREVAVFGHVRTVASRYCAKFVVQPELGQSLLGSNSIDFGKNELFTVVESRVSSKRWRTSLELQAELRIEEWVFEFAKPMSVSLHSHRSVEKSKGLAIPAPKQFRQDLFRDVK